MVKNPLYAYDATATARAELLKNYDLQIVKTYEEANVMGMVFPEQNINDPGADSHNWDVAKSAKRAKTTRDGESGADGSIAFDTASNKFVVTDQSYQIKKYSLDRALKSNRNLDMETAMAVAYNIISEKDYQLWNGNSDYGLTSIKSLAQDAGAPGGVWDVAGKMYADVLAVIGKVRTQGYDGVLNTVITPGILSKMDEQVSISATETLSMTYREWISGLTRGGLLLASSNPFTANSGPSKTKKATGSAGTAVNQIFVAAPMAAEIIDAHGLLSRNVPTTEGNVHKNVSVKYTSKVSDGKLIAYMDAIDLAT